MLSDRLLSFLPGLILAVGLLVPGLAFGQQANITGTVTNAETGEPIPGVNVFIRELGPSVAGTATDDDGSYNLEIPPRRVRGQTATLVDRLGGRVLGAAVLRATSDTDLADVASRLGIPVLGAVPADPDPDAGSGDEPVVVADPDRPVSAAYQGLAEQLSRVLIGASTPQTPRQHSRTPGSRTGMPP